MIERLVPTQDVAEGSSSQGFPDREELARIFRAAVREAIAGHLAADQPVFSGGSGDEEGTLFMHTPDGRRFECLPHLDGSYEVLREVAPESLG